LKLPHLLLAFAATALIITIGGVIAIRTMVGGDVPLGGWVAYGFGAGFSILVSAGLFFLLFYSARSGYDDIDRPEDDSSM
jgi:hypothetical protein